MSQSHFTTRVADVPGAIKLIGRLIGADCSQMEFTHSSAVFLPGDLINGQTSLAEGIVVSVDGNTKTVIGSINGTFSDTEVIACDLRGITATVSSIDRAQQAIKMFGGNRFHITDALFTNASVSLNTIAGGQIHDGNENLYVNTESITSTVTEFLRELQTPEDYIDNNKANNYLIFMGTPANGYIVPSLILNVTTLYFSYSTPEGTPATVDIYIFGFVIN